MPKKAEKVPNVVVLKNIRPQHERSGEATLKYPNLAGAVMKYLAYDGARWQEFIDAQEDSIEEEKKAETLAKQYLLFTSHELNKAADPASKQLWSERFTQASIELHGQPDANISRKLLAQQRREFEALRGNLNVSQSQLEWLLGKYDEYSIESSPENVESSEAIERSAEVVSAVLHERFADVLKIFEDGNPEDEISPEEIAHLFDIALDMLKQRDDAWQEWVVELTDDSNLSRVKEKIKVGKNRLPAKRKELAGLFAHETLIHGLRAVNGKKHAKELKTGLPNYLTAEEGIALLAEYGISGEMPQKMIDRYVDISLALGQITDKPVARKDLFVFASARNVIRAQAARTEEEILADKDGTKQQNKAHTVQTEALRHVNRIYRGTLGNEHVGVFTKDAEYYKGIILISEYIQTEIEKGKTIAEVFDYIMQGKFDPTNEKHKKFVEKVVG